MSRPVSPAVMHGKGSNTKPRQNLYHRHITAVISVASITSLLQQCDVGSLPRVPFPSVSGYFCQYRWPLAAISFLLRKR